jgi:hypothetical protein
MNQPNDQRRVKLCIVELQGRQPLHYTEALFGQDTAACVREAVLRASAQYAYAKAPASWRTYAVSNGSFLMAPSDDDLYWVRSDGGELHRLSATGFGLACCLRAYKWLSARGDDLGELCRSQYALLRRVVQERADASQVIGYLS